MQFCRLISIVIAFVVLSGLRPALTSAAETDDALLELAIQPWSGDLDGIIERGFLRIVTAYNPLFFSYDDDAKTKGLVAEMAREFEKHLNETVVPKGKHLNVIVFPAPRDEILNYVAQGRADIADANLTITAKRSEIVSFAKPLFPEVSEIVVTGPGAGKISSLDDLVSQGIYTRESSSYFTHLGALNQKRLDIGLNEIAVGFADENLEDHDLLDLVDNGILDAIIIDSHKAELWQQVFENITVHEDLIINEDSEISWALRKDAPELMAAVNSFMETATEGTLLGNILINRYFSSPEGIESLRDPNRHQEISDEIDIIKHYSDQYDFDWLMIFAQAFQESGLDQSKRSKAGAVGVMQVLPSTASDANVGISDIDELANNVHAGVRYLRFLRDRYFSDPEIAAIDQILLSFAAYNAGPRKVAQARAKAEQMGFDPNVWFGHVEVSAAKTISQEPVIYVRNIFRYYVAYEHLEKMRLARQEIINVKD